CRRSEERRAVCRWSSRRRRPSAGARRGAPVQLRLLQAPAYLNQFVEQAWEQRKGQSVRSVRQRLRGVVVNFHEKTVHARRHSGAREMRNVLRLAAGTLSLSAGQLKAVRDIEYDGTSKTLHDGKRAEVHYQIVVAERCAALGENQSLAARFADLVHN